VKYPSWIRSARSVSFCLIRRPADAARVDIPAYVFVRLEVLPDVEKEGVLRAKPMEGRADELGARLQRAALRRRHAVQQVHRSP